MPSAANAARFVVGWAIRPAAAPALVSATVMTAPARRKDAICRTEDRSPLLWQISPQTERASRAYAREALPDEPRPAARGARPPGGPPAPARHRRPKRRAPSPKPWQTRKRARTFG